MGMVFGTSGFRRLLDTDTDSNTTAPALHAKDVPVNLIQTFGMQGLRLRFYSDTAAGDWTVDLYAVDIIGSIDAPDSYTAIPIGSVSTINSGTTTGVVGSIVNGEVNWADVVAWTVSDFGNDLLAYTGARILDFTTTNGIGEVMISDCGNIWGISCVFQDTDGSETYNIVYKLDKV